MAVNVALDTRLREDGRGRLRITIFRGGVLARVPLEIHVAPKYWDRARKRVKLGDPMAQVYNHAIEQAVTRAETLSIENAQWSAEELREAMTVRKASGHTFLEVTLSDLKEFPPKSWHTAQLREGNVRRFDVFSPDIRTRAITPLVAQKYHAHILARGVTRNTAATQMHVLRTLYNRACKIEGLEPKRILADVDHVERYNTVPEFLVPAEVELLKGYASKVTGWAQKAVHMWLFSLYAGGMRWTDLCLLTWGNVKGGRVTFTANKTGKAKNVELHPEASRLLHHIGGANEMIFGIDPDPGSIAAANKAANCSLKIAAHVCGINKRIHTHNARHSFAAWALAAGMDDRAIQQILGVDDKAFRHYRARFSVQVIDEGMRRVLG